MARLQISNPRERLLVSAADAALRPLGWLPRRPSPSSPKRVLLLRLERIGDLLMVLDGIADARAAWPNAEIDLAVGSWNLPLARLIPGITRVITLDAPWLAREGTGDRWSAMIFRARGWRRQGGSEPELRRGAQPEPRYDLAINFEPD